jgi:hypothetical protein
MGTSMIVPMTAAGMARHIFRQSIGPEECNVFGNRSFPCLENSHSGAIEFVQRPAANPAHHYCIHLMAAKARYRIAGPMLMNFVAVVDRNYLAGDHIHHDKLWRRPKMPIHLTLQPLIFQNRKTDFHCVSPFIWFTVSSRKRNQLPIFISDPDYAFRNMSLCNWRIPAWHKLNH